MGFDIVKKIKAMVAKAESTPSLEEAETIMIMVRRMLDHHGISLLTIQNTVMSDDPVEVDHDVYGYWASDNWMKKLAVAAAEYYGVRIVWVKQGNYTSISVIGRESCRAAYLFMLPYLRLRVMRVAQDGWRHHRYKSASRARTQIGIALSYRLYALADMDRKKVRPANETAGRNMLVPVDEIEATIREAFPTTRGVTIKTRANISRQAIEDAASINLNDQMKDESFQQRISR
jgi:hypothetical protein